MQRKHSTSAGFTIIELMVTIAVLSVLLGIGVPAMTDIIRRNRVVAQTNAVVGALNFARNQTGTRGIPVTMCAANANRDGCNATDDWSNGWIIFADRTNAGTRENDEELLQVSNGVAGGFTFDASGAFVRFGVGASPSTEITFTLTPTDFSVCKTAKRRVITVANTGRVNTAKDETCS